MTVYTTETLELSLLPVGDYLMDTTPDWDSDLKVPTTVRLGYTRKGNPMLIHTYQGKAQGRAVVFPKTHLVTIYTTLEDLSESERIDIEWDLMNRKGN